MNCNLLAPNSDCRKMKLMEFLDSLTLHQFVQVPTYRSGSLLDICVSNRANFVVNLHVSECAYSDHFF